MSRLISQPPVLDSPVQLVNNNHVLSPIWQRYFSELDRYLSQYITSFLDLNLKKQSTFTLPKLTITIRDSLKSVEIGTLIYNSTTDKINVYKSNGWIEI